ncbi:MAG TPA: hypothetical protein VGI19_10990 [Candidatus Cybelea sp.]|jgi:hypothetical protein
MPLALSVLLTLHILLVTLGYGGLIVANAWVALQLRAPERGAALTTLRTAISILRTFGPMIAVGMLVGFAMAAWLHIGLLSLWLIVAYAVIVVAIALQAGVAVPWNVRTLRTLEAGDGLAAVDTRIPAAVAGLQTIAFALLVLVMVWRPA